jgi:hypothetical protein
MMNSQAYQMKTGSECCDLRILSLLCALGDKEEIVCEAYRLLLGPGMNEAIWFQVQEIGREIVPDHPLFDNNRALDQLRIEYAKRSSHSDSPITTTNCMGVGQRRGISDRSLEERRVTTLPWLGEERRQYERRSNKERESSI